LTRTIPILRVFFWFFPNPASHAIGCGRIPRSNRQRRGTVFTIPDALVTFWRKRDAERQAEGLAPVARMGAAD